MSDVKRYDCYGKDALGYDCPALSREAIDGDWVLAEDHIAECDAPRVCIENPIPHKYARALIGGYTQRIQPWQFWHLDEPGAGESKATCLWLENLPPLVPTTPLETGRHQACWRMGPSPERSRERSRTYLGIADAMGDQWGR